MYYITTPKYVLFLIPHGIRKPIRFNSRSDSLTDMSEKPGINGMNDIS
jgi:hypothetical protein